MTFANSIIAYSGLMVGSRLHLVNFEAECFSRLIQMVWRGFVGVELLATSSVLQDAYSVSTHMGNPVHKIKQLKSWSCPVLLE